MQQFGRAIGNFGDVFDSLQRDQDDLDLFKARIETAKWQEDQNRKQVEWDSQIKDDGQGHTDTRLSQYDTDAEGLRQRVPQSKRAQQFVMLHTTDQRNRYHQQSFNTEMKRRGEFYFDATTGLITQQVLPRITGDIESAEAALQAADGIIGGADGMPEGIRSKAREHAAEEIYKAWLDKAGPEAGAQFEALQKRYRPMQNPDDTGGMDVPADGAKVERNVRVPGGVEPKPVQFKYSPPIRGQRQSAIEGVVIHHTSGSSLEGALSHGSKKGTGATFYVDRDGEIYRWADDDKLLIHSREPDSQYRKGRFPNLRNDNTIGIEVVARNDKDVTPEQRASLHAFLGSLANQHKFDPKNVVGHGEIQGGPGGNKEDDEGRASAQAFRDNQIPAGELVRVADASGRTQYNVLPRTTADYFRDRVLKSGPEIYNKALQAERRLDEMERKAVAEEDKKAVAEGVELFAQKQLTPEWIDANKDRFSSAWTADRFRRMLGDGPRATNWAEFQPVKDIARERPLEAIERAAQLYGERKLEHQDFVALYNDATREMKNRKAWPDYVKRAQTDLRQQLRPPYGASEDDWRTYGQASREMERFIEDGLANKTLKDADLVKFKDKLIQDTRTQTLRQQRQQLPSLPFIPKSSEVLDLDDVRGALRQHMQNAGSMSPEEFNRRLSDLRQWDDQIQKEYRLQGKPIPPMGGAKTPGAAQKPAGGQTPQQGGQGSQDPSSPFYDPSQEGQQQQKKGWWPWGQPSKLGGPMEEVSGAVGKGTPPLQSGAVGEFTNTKQDSEDIDLLAKAQRTIAENPGSSRAMAALLGAADVVTNGALNQRVMAPYRSSYPLAFRAPQAAMLGVTAAGMPKVGVPWAALTISRDPAVQQFYRDNIAPLIDDQEAALLRQAMQRVAEGGDGADAVGGQGSDAVAGGPMQPGGGIGSDAVATGTAGMAQGQTPDQQALIERMRGAGVDEASLMQAVRLANAPGNYLNDPATPQEFKGVPFAGPMLNVIPLAMAIQQVGKGMIVEGWNTASRWLQASQQLPGAKATDTLVAPRGTEDYQINPNRVEDHDFLAPLGLAGMASPAGSLAAGASRRLTAGTTPTTAREAAVARGREELYAPQSDMGAAAQFLEGGLRNKYHDMEGFKRYVDGIREFDRAEPPTRAVTEDGVDATKLLSDAGKRSSLPGMIQGAVENASRSEKGSSATNQVLPIDWKEARATHLEQKYGAGRVDDRAPLAHNEDVFFAAVRQGIDSGAKYVKLDNYEKHGQAIYVPIDDTVKDYIKGLDKPPSAVDRVQGALNKSHNLWVGIAGTVMKAVRDKRSFRALTQEEFEAEIGRSDRSSGAANASESLTQEIIGKDGKPLQGAEKAKAIDELYAAQGIPVSGGEGEGRGAADRNSRRIQNEEGFKNKFERDDPMLSMTQIETDLMHEFIRQKRKANDQTPLTDLLNEWREMLRAARQKP